MVFGGETAESYYDEGVTAAMKGDVGLAVQHFQRAIKLDPYHVASYHQLGKCNVRLGNLRQAVECFYRAIKARPNPIPPRIDLGFALLEGGNHQRAAEVFREVLHVKPENAKALLGLGCCAYARGEWDEAYAMATQAVSLGGANFASLYLQARAARLTGLPDAAVDAFEKADALLERSIESNPDLPEAYFLRGELFFARENFVAALEAFQAAEQRIKPDAHYYSYGEHFELAHVLARRGMCQLRLGQTEKARESGRQLQEVDPNNRAIAVLTGDGATEPTHE